MRSFRLSLMLLALGACSAPEPMDSGTLLREPSTSSGMPQSAAPSTAGSGATQTAVGAAGAGPRQTTSGAAMSAAGTPAMRAAAGGSSVAPAAAGTAAPRAANAAGTGGQSGAGPSTASGAAGSSAGSGAMMAAAGAGGGSAPSMSSGPSMGTLTLSFTTKSYGGQYAPGNYGAVWFESPSGEFIKTVKRWAGAAHAGDLGAWNEASGGWGSLFGGGGNMADMMDAMSSATLRQHQSHTVMWNMKDAEKMVVPDGDYVAVVEMTEDRGATPGPVLRIPFKKGPEPQMVDVPDEMSFTDISLTYQP